LPTESVTDDEVVAAAPDQNVMAEAGRLLTESVTDDEVVAAAPDQNVIAEAAIDGVIASEAKYDIGKICGLVRRPVDDVAVLDELPNSRRHQIVEFCASHKGHIPLPRKSLTSKTRQAVFRKSS
jgi:hypothetical protein